MCQILTTHIPQFPPFLIIAWRVRIYHTGVLLYLGDVKTLVLAGSLPNCHLAMKLHRQHFCYELQCWLE